MDSGALLATCAGSGATLVAIIGGFLLTRYMAVESEIRGADRAIAQGKLRLASVAERRERAREDLTDHEIDEAFDSDSFITLLVACFDNDAAVTVDDARASVPLGRFSDQDIARRLGAWRAEVERARTARVWSSVRRSATYASLRTFLSLVKVDAEITPVWRVLYDSEKESKRIQADHLTAMSGVLDDFDLHDSEEAAKTTYSERFHQAEVEFESAQAEMRVAQAARLAIPEPTGLQWEVVVLGLVAALTIAPSLLLLAPQPARLDRVESGAVVTSFALGLTLLIAYLIRWSRKARDAWQTGADSADLDFVIES